MPDGNGREHTAEKTTHMGCVRGCGEQGGVHRKRLPHNTPQGQTSKDLDTSHQTPLSNGSTASQLCHPGGGACHHHMDLGWALSKLQQWYISQVRKSYQKAAELASGRPKSTLLSGKAKLSISSSLWRHRVIEATLVVSNMTSQGAPEPVSREIKEHSWHNC